MLKSEFENFPIWTVCDELKAQIERISPTLQGDEVTILNRIQFIADHLRSFRSTASVMSPFVNDLMLVPVHQQISASVEQLRAHPGVQGYAHYSETARTCAENALMAAGTWPQPLLNGAQAIRMETLYEDLIQAQRRQIEQMQAEFAGLAGAIEAMNRHVDSRKTEADAHFEVVGNRASVVEASVDAEKARMDSVIQSGLESIDQLKEKNTLNFTKWIEDRQEDWTDIVAEHKGHFGRARNEVSKMLESLKKQETEFANITSAAAAGKLASDFENEATNSKRWGLGLYGAGAMVLILATLPLLWILVDQTGSPEKQWQQLAARLSIGIIAASGATVLIRLGARFISGSTASKRMALELRTMGPFLANVEDQASVDAARLELVDRAFGKSYVTDVNTEKEDGVSVSAFSHVIDLVKALNK
ncbi:hypothetical protein [Arthrobacter sp. B2a2-09]|uniref:hypothetical protein n=1 Tax=Arthrobacter sp. B2a2-09 TaxID=2952822 RepID=UPI0022CD5DEA|nr:hypothetical protein [Arthrobacter sp. B2a2-09]MCZ9883903.1 hypothetical protein [Arthrobacter sp. B2a2-09]